MAQAPKHWQKESGRGSGDLNAQVVCNLFSCFLGADRAVAGQRGTISGAGGDREPCKEDVPGFSDVRLRPLGPISGSP